MQQDFSQRFFLSAGEANAEQEMSLPLLTSKLIDLATLHANSLGVGNPAMASLGAGWVLSRLTVEMERFPHANDSYSISTWVEEWNRHFSRRAFAVAADDGSILGYARSIWMVMGTDSHTNVGLSHLTPPEGMISSRQCPIDRQERHRPVILPGEPDLPGALVATAPQASYTFKYCDLDSYRHVNTVRYVRTILNQFSLDDFDATMPHRLELSFMHEARYGMTVEILRSDSPSNPLLSSFLMRDSISYTPILYARLLRTPRL